MVLGDSHPLGLDPRQALLAIVLVVAFVVIGGLVGRMIIGARHLDVSGYRFGADVVVRCRDGHLFTTTWIPLASFKAIRLGLVRLQYCPVGQHITFVTLLKDSDLTD